MASEAIEGPASTPVNKGHHACREAVLSSPLDSPSAPILPTEKLTTCIRVCFVPVLLILLSR